MEIPEVFAREPGSEVTVEGWIEDKRPVGEILFLTVRDQHGDIQIVVKGSEDPELRSVADSVPRQSAVRIKGVLQKGHGRPEIHPTEIAVLGLAEHPLPLDPTGRTPTGLEVMLDSRPLSIRMPPVAAVFKFRSTLSLLTYEFFHDHGFVEVHSPKIIASASEGGAELFEVKYFDGRAYLAQSPQLYKEELMLGFKKVFELAQYWRAEKSHTTRHLTEFTSLDVEVAYTDYHGVMDVLEEYVCRVVERLGEAASSELETLKTELPTCESPFPRLTYDQCVELLEGSEGGIKWGEDFGSDSLEALGEEYPSFYFIYDWPTEAKPFYIGKKSDDPERSESFDLMYGKMEIASGGTRVNDPHELDKRLVAQGLDPRDFEHHSRVFRQGMPPHAGWAVGFDRFVQILSGRGNIREAVMYPRDPERLLP